MLSKRVASIECGWYGITFSLRVSFLKCGWHTLEVSEFTYMGYIILTPVTLFCFKIAKTQDVAQGFLYKIRINLVINLEIYIMQWSYKVYHLPLAETSHTRLNNLYRWFLKANNSAIVTPPLLIDGWSESTKLYLVLFISSFILYVIREKI